MSALTDTREGYAVVVARRADGGLFFSHGAGGSLPIFFSRRSPAEEHLRALRAEGLAASVVPVRLRLETLAARPSPPGGAA